MTATANANAHSHSHASSAEIRAKLNHPIVDCDGHMLEHVPVFLDFLKETAGPDMVAHYLKCSREGKNGRWYALTPEERRVHRPSRPPFWGIPSGNTLDRATSMLPGLLRERLDELGLDFTIVYPTLGFFLFDEPEEDVRRACCRAQNAMVSELYRDHADRMTPAASIPMFTPAEAIEELEYAVDELDLKVAMIASLVHRPLDTVNGDDPTLRDFAYWIDNLSLDSQYDYDPFWAKCMELGIAPTAHSFMQGHGARRSITNYMYNQIGHFADAGETFAKALFFGGVTRRFPDLNFGVLEGGVGWAASLFCTLVEVWGKRGFPAIENLDPARLDLEQLEGLFSRYGGKRFSGSTGNVAGLGYSALSADAVPREADLALMDDFAACGIEKAEDIVDLFAEPIYFGCEADDKLTGIACSGKALPFGAKLKPVFGSDIGHWDVPNMNEVLGEAYELVEDELLDEEGFRDFTFANAVRLHGGMNPKFFEGTVVEAEAKAILDR